MHAPHKEKHVREDVCTDMRSSLRQGKVGRGLQRVIDVPGNGQQVNLGSFCLESVV